MATASAATWRQAERALFECAPFISLESDQILHHAAKISPYPEIAHQHKLFVYLIAGGRRLLAGPGVDVAHVDLQAVENGVALGRLAFFEGLPIELLDEEHRGAAGQHAVVADQFLAR